MNPLSTKNKFSLPRINYCFIPRILLFCIFSLVVDNRSANAGWPGECTKVTYWKNPASHRDAVEANIYSSLGFDYDGSTGYFSNTGTEYRNENNARDSVLQRSYYYENEAWHLRSRLSNQCFSNGQFHGAEVYEQNYMPTGPCPCDEADKAQKIAACGGEDYAIWVENTCTAICRCIGQNEEKREEAILRCEPYGGLLFYSLEECRGECYPDSVCSE